MRIKEVMKSHGITQEELAARMDINRVSVNRLLSEKNDMRMSTLQKFADAIGCRVTELIEERSEEFTAFIKYKDIHYTADSLDELNKIVEELNIITK